MKKVIVFVFILNIFSIISFADDDNNKNLLYNSDEIKVFEKFYYELKEAILSGDKYKASKMNNYPLFVTTENGEKIIQNKKEFIDDFENIVNTCILDVLKKTDFDKLSLMYSGYKVGEGQILIDVDPREGSKFNVLVVAFNNTKIQPYDEILQKKQKELTALKGKWKKLLADKISSADRVEIFSTWPPPNKLLLSIIGKDKVKEFLALIDIDEEKSGNVCQCLGDVYLLFCNMKNELVKMSYHHGNRLRWPDSGWINDAILTKESEDKILKWFLDQGFQVKEYVTSGDNEMGDVK